MPLPGEVSCSNWASSHHRLLPVGAQAQGAFEGLGRTGRVAGGVGRIGTGEVRLGLVEIRLGQVIHEPADQRLVGDAGKAAVEPHQRRANLVAQPRQRRRQMGFELLDPGAAGRGAGRQLLGLG